MHRIGIRQLRNETSRVVRRAMSGERIVVTIDGVPAAELGPLTDVPPTLDELVAAGRVRPPRTTVPPPPPLPRPPSGGRRASETLLRERER